MYNYFFKIYSLEKRLFIINFTLLFFLGLMETFSVLSVAPIFDLFLGRAQGMGVVTKYTEEIFEMFSLELNKFTAAFTLVSIVSVKTLTSLLQKKVALNSKYRIFKELMVGSLNDYFSGGLPFFLDVNQGTLVNTFNKEIAGIGNAYFTYINLLANVIRVFFFLLPPLLLSWKLTVFSIVLFSLAYIPSILVNKISYNKGKLNTSTANDLQISINELLNSAKVILGFGAEKKAGKILSHSFDTHAEATIPFQMINYFLVLIYEPVFLVALLILLYVAIDIFGLPISSVIVVLYALRSAAPQITSIISDKNVIIGSIPSLEQIERLRNKALYMKLESGSRQFDKFKHDISLNNVSYAYKKTGKGIRNISLTIKKGEKVSIVGPSGSGKTTLVDIITGLYGPTEGLVLIDGENLMEFDSESYRKKVSYVSQDPMLFNLTLKENMEFFTSDLTDEEILSACRNANVEDVYIRNQNIVCSDKGSNLSGGERQRLCLARALVRNSELLILDEVTSSIDKESESKVLGFFRSLGEDATVISITHKLETLQMSDKIIFLEEGELVGVGSFSSLLQNNQKFKAFFNKSI